MEAPEGENSAAAEDPNPAPPDRSPPKSDKAPVISTTVLWVLLAVAILSTCVFAGLFVSELLKDKKTEEKIVTVFEEMTASNTSAAVEFCNTPDCVITAASILKSMNLSANPCMDFYEYACGRFIKETPYPPGSSNVDPLVLNTKKNNAILKEILQEPTNPNEPKYSSNMKRYFMSCLNEAQIEQKGVQDFLNQQRFIELWPVLYPEWNETTFHLNHYLEYMAANFVKPVYGFMVVEDLKDQTKIALYLNEPTLVLGKEYFMQPRDSPVIKAYEKFLVDTAVELGAARDIAETDAKEVVDLEIALSKIKLPSDQARDFSKQYNPVTMKKLGEMYPEIDLPRALRAGFSTANVQLEDDTIIINRFPGYMGNLFTVLNNSSKRAVANQFGFSYASYRIEGLTKRLREIKFEFKAAHMGTLSAKARADECQEEVAGIFGNGLGKQYVTRVFSDSAKASVRKIAATIQEEFKKTLTDNEWLGQASKDEALKKLSKIKLKIGYPDEGFADSDMEEQYKDHIMEPDNFYANRLLGKQLTDIETMRKFARPLNKFALAAPAYVTNAYYNPPANEMVFFAGVLRPPFFSEKWQNAMSYGSVGAIIGHEITHGFDDKGSQFDSDGSLRNWWQQEDRENFIKRTKCIIDQFSNFTAPEINMKVNGINVQGEAVADTDGLKTAYRTYKHVSSETGNDMKLPGLALTQDQLFFIAFAQFRCARVTPEYMKFTIAMDPHPPYRFRVLGTLQNSDDFSQAYNCPKGSYMNPENKCKVWY